MKYTIYSTDSQGNKEVFKLLISDKEVIETAQTFLHYDAMDVIEGDKLADMTIDDAISQLENSTFKVEAREEGLTSNENLKKSMLEIAKDLLNRYEQDIETGIEDGTYKEDDNIETRRFIQKAHEVFSEYEKSQAAIYIYMEGGLIQGVSATESIELNVYDADCAEDVDPEYIELNGTAEEWEQNIDEKTAAGVIRNIF